MPDPVLPADPIKQHLALRRPEPAGEHLPIVGQDLIRDPMGAHRFGQSVTHRPRRRSSHHLGRHTEPGVIVDPGHHLQLGAIRQEHPTHDVHLPQLHRPGPLPPPVIRPAPPPLLRIHQTMAHQSPIHRRTRRHRLHPLLTQLIENPARTPTRMSPTHLHHPSLHPNRHLMRTRHRLRAPIHQTGQPVRGVAAQPPMNRLPSHPKTGGPHPSPTPRPTLPTPPDTAAPRHPAPPTRSDPSTRRHQPRHRRRGETRSRGSTSVRHLPEPVSPRNRSRVHKLSPSNRSHSVHHEPKPHKRDRATCATRRPKAAGGRGVQVTRIACQHWRFGGLRG
jgi:hypothetical protein